MKENSKSFSGNEYSMSRKQIKTETKTGENQRMTQVRRSADTSDAVQGGGDISK